MEQNLGLAALKVAEKVFVTGQGGGIPDELRGRPEMEVA
jgi:hypothetical protein